MAILWLYMYMYMYSYLVPRLLVIKTFPCDNLTSKFYLILIFKFFVFQENSDEASSESEVEPRQTPPTRGKKRKRSKAKKAKRSSLARVSQPVEEENSSVSESEEEEPATPVKKKAKKRLVIVLFPPPASMSIPRSCSGVGGRVLGGVSNQH